MNDSVFKPGKSTEEILESLSKGAKNLPDSSAPKAGGVIDGNFETNRIMQDDNARLWRAVEKINDRLKALESKESTDAGE